MMLNHRELFMDTLVNRLNSGYMRCLDRLRLLMPDVPHDVQNQRFVFLGAYLGSVLAFREIAVSDKARSHKTWGSDATLRHFIGTACAILQAPVEASPAMHSHPPQGTPSTVDVVDSVGMIVSWQAASATEAQSG